jgi:hypothetical protein
LDFDYFPEENVKTKVLHTILILSLLSLALLALGGDQARAQEAEPLAPEALSDEAWRYGVTVEGALSYAALDGRLIAETAAFRSARDDDIYFVFPAPATQKTVTAVRYYLVSRSGAYAAGNATLTLQIFNFAGVLVHTVSAATINMKTAPTGSWQAHAMSAAANRVINPGQFLAFHFHLSAGAGGSLDVRPIFEVILQ